MNRVYLKGRAGGDVEIAHLPSGMAVGKFGLAVSKKVKEEWQTMWVRVVTFGRVAESAKNMVVKGAHIMLEGELSIREYTDKNGQRKTSTEVVAHTMVAYMSKTALPDAQDTSFEPGGSPSEEF